MVVVLTLTLINTGLLLVLLVRLMRWRRQSAELVVSSVREAYNYCGLPQEQYSPEFNLVHSGKLADVLVRAARTLDSDQRFETIQDVIDALSKGRK